MKKFIEKNAGYIILSMMLVGAAALGFGLDWDQTQVHWKEKFVVPLIVTGSALFLGGCAWLATGTWGQKTPK
jgi:hypothetical protein